MRHTIQFPYHRILTVILGAALFVVALAFLAGCGQQQKSEGPIPIKVGYSPGVCNAALFVAYENGYFA